MRGTFGILIALSVFGYAPVNAQKTKGSVSISMPSYADIADLADPASIVAEVKVRNATKIRKKDDAATATARFLVEAEVLALIRGADGLPRRIRYVVEPQPNALGKLPKLGGAVLIAFAVPVRDRPGEIQLVGPDAQLAWSEQLGVEVRRIVREIARPEAPPRVTGIANAYFTPGALSGDSESQIFLSTSGDLPVSLMVTRKTGVAPRWAAAFGEVVDPQAPVPARNTLEWYRLACFLPASLPASTEGLTPESALKVATDYQLVREGLGACPRTRGVGPSR
jgi:hypothetical protein